ncbi:MAG: hypothetical protein KDI61_03305 [Alphaproteobacteria bacterium]|nr:hypothetical protein [Alphaproteobacteria bacterium]MCB1839279.1 hypothetical protein [Alphaproteobacteria bacterium]
MTRQKPEKLEKRAAALRENLRRRKPKASGDAKKAQKKKNTKRNEDGKDG